MPRYEFFDKAHGPNHVSAVIENSLAIAKDHDADIDKVYVIAAYHDLGLIQGRENHEKNSAVILRSDPMLEQWFSKDELLLMAEAIEDHRASNDHEPRSIYGKIVAEADRDIDYMTILTRVAFFSLEYFSDYTPEQHYVRSYEHMEEKYGENGYLKLWLDTERNRRNLSKLRNAMASGKFKDDFMRIISEIS